MENLKVVVWQARGPLACGWHDAGSCGECREGRKHIIADAVRVNENVSAFSIANSFKRADNNVREGDQLMRP